MAARGIAVLVAIVLVWLPTSLGVTAVAASGHGDPLRAEQWGLDLVGIDEAWPRSRGDGAVVAVIDTGVAFDHPDLADRFVRDRQGRVLGLDLVDGGDPQDTHGHGTLVAGIVAATADNGEGIAGVAPRARLLPIRILDGRGAGTGGDVDRAIRWAVDRGADVINLSLEAAAPPDGERSGPAVPTAAVRYATERGVVVVVAAGNSAGSAAAYPADTPALLVGAVDRDDRPAAFSDVGRVDAVLAPGVDVVSTWCRRTPSGCDVAAAPYGVAEGTSFAAPHVSGVAALLAARGLSAEEIVDRIRDTAVDLGPPGPDEAHGVGRLDAAAAVGGLGDAGSRSASVPDRSPTPSAEAPEPPAPEPEPEPEPGPDPDPAPAPEVPTVEDPVPSPSEEDPAASGPAPEEVPEPADVPVEEPVEADEPPRAVPVAAPGDPPRTSPPLAARAAADGGTGLRGMELVAVLVLVLTMVLWSRTARVWGTV